MKSKLLLLLLLALALSGFAQTEPPAAKPISVGILTWGGPRRTLANNIVALITVDLSADDRFAVVDRDELKKVLEEQALGKSGTITSNTAARIGQLTGAKVLVSGREFSLGNDIVIVANVIGTENGRVFSTSAQGSSSNLVDLISGLSQKIAQVIATQSTNLLAPAAPSHDMRIEQIVKRVEGKQRPSVSIKINEQMPHKSPEQHTAETELGMIFQKAGFTVTDEKSDDRADVLITGDAIFTSSQKNGSLYSGRAILSLKARQRTTGKILSLDRQDAVAADVSEPIAAMQALQNATDDLAERLLPLLAQ